MELLNNFKALLETEATQLTATFIPQTNVTPALTDTTPLSAGGSYFRLWVERMYLKVGRKWFQDWYPVVQGVTTFSFGSPPNNLMISQVAGPDALRNIDPNHLDHVVGLNIALTPLLPFNGGTVQIEAGLMAMPTGEPVTDRFLKAMTSFSSLVVVPQLSTVLNVADALNKGVSALFDVGSKHLVLGYQQTFTSAGGGGSNDLQAGYIALINGASASYPANSLWVRDNLLQQGATPDQMQPITATDYMLLRIETRQTRDDWKALTTISGPFDQAMDALDDIDDNGNPRVADGDAYIRAAVVAARHSPDLTDTDRNQLMRSLRDTYNKAKATAAGGAGVRDLVAPPLTLDDVAAHARHLDASPVSVGELFS